MKAFNAKGLADVTQGELKYLEENRKIPWSKGLASLNPKEENGNPQSLNLLSTSKLSSGDGDIVFSAAGGWAPVLLGVYAWKRPPSWENAGTRDPKD